MRNRRNGERTRVFFVIGKLSGGGAERVVVRILRHLDREKFQPFLVVFEREGAFLADVPEDVPILDCRRRSAGGGQLRWFGHLLRFFREERPEVAISFMWFSNAATLVARILSRVPCRVVVSERMSILGTREGIAAEMARKAAISVLYRTADRILCNSEAMGSQFVEHHRFLHGRIVVIPNPVDTEDIEVQKEEPENTIAIPEDLPLVVGAGRLSREKGFDVLLRAAVGIRTPCTLLILGEGNEEERLRRLAEALGLKAGLIFGGFRKNPYPYIGRAAVFVLPSRYEGFPNALLEAMALGVPCVATRCPTGPEEIITDGVDGLLVPVEDPEALAGAIDTLLLDDPLRIRISAAARNRALDFDVSRVIPRIGEMIEDLAVAGWRRS